MSTAGWIALASLGAVVVGGAFFFATRSPPTAAAPAPTPAVLPSGGGRSERGGSGIDAGALFGAASAIVGSLAGSGGKGGVK